MHAKDFLRMFAYDHWANRECLTAMKDAGSVSAGTVGRMAHILSAQKLWLERILKQPQSMPVWPTYLNDKGLHGAGRRDVVGVAKLPYAACDTAPARLARRQGRIPQQ